MNNLLVVDTREKKNASLLKYFDSIGQDYIISKLEFGDYMFYKKPEIVVERKANILEIIGNLCNASHHQRFLREIQRARDNGCEKFYIVICENGIRSEDDIKKWSSDKSRIKGETLLKIMKTMKERYGCIFVFIDKKYAAKKIISLLEDKNG